MIIYYTDGSASPNPGPGGFAVIKNGAPHILGSEEGETTNIRMEGKALVAALTDAAGEEAEIFTDSEFWINVIT
jgi:ribonuclease HI